MNQLVINENMRESTQHGSLYFPIQYYVDELFQFSNQTIPLHWHPELEFFLVNGGSVRIQIGKTQFCLEEGFGILINSNVLHGFRQVEEEARCRCPNIVFLDELIAPVSSQIYKRYIQPITRNRRLPYIVLDPSHGWQREVLTHLDCIFSLLQKYGPYGFYGRPPALRFQNNGITSSCFELAVQNELNQIWQLLFSFRDEIPQLPWARNEYLLQIRTQRMLEYIRCNYSRPISLNKIAASAGISKSEAARCFQAYLHTSPVKYLLEYRIEMAKQELQKGEETVEAISERCGFRSSSYFCRVFRNQTGMTASQFRAEKWDGRVSGEML